jgi:hypothetical protein
MINGTKCILEVDIGSIDIFVYEFDFLKWCNNGLELACCVAQRAKAFMTMV